MNELQNTTGLFIDWSFKTPQLPDSDEEKKPFLQRWEFALQYQHICRGLQECADEADASLVLGSVATRSELTGAFEDDLEHDGAGIGFTGQCLAQYFRSGELTIYYANGNDRTSRKIHPIFKKIGSGGDAEFGKHIVDTLTNYNERVANKDALGGGYFTVEWNGDPCKVITIHAPVNIKSFCKVHDLN